jgi:hypothetical protein
MKLYPLAVHWRDRNDIQTVLECLVKEEQSHEARNGEGVTEAA